MEIREMIVKVDPAEDTAIASYVLYVKTKLPDEKVTEEENQEADVWFEHNGAWKVAVLHNSPLRRSRRKDSAEQRTRRFAEEKGTVRFRRPNSHTQVRRVGAPEAWLVDSEADAFYGFCAEAAGFIAWRCVIGFDED
jgi:hypothetical protein